MVKRSHIPLSFRNICDILRVHQELCLFHIISTTRKENAQICFVVPSFLFTALTSTGV